MINVDYGMTRTFPKTTLPKVRERITAALKNEGFGILTEIDISATLKSKIDVDFRPYVILGACNPRLAHQALSHDLGIGLLLPCNVVLAQTDSGDVEVSIAKPRAMFEVVHDDTLEPLVMQATEKLTRALESA
ncbi:MAG: DUF302 domain-containing protein [Myxococcota bacterium]